MTALFPALDPADYRRHAFHGPDRIWPEGNCYSDLWIEILPAAGLPPEAIFGFTVTQDFEGDHFTFFKPPLEDIEALFGIVVQELAIYDDRGGVQPPTKYEVEYWDGKTWKVVANAKATPEKPTGGQLNEVRFDGVTAAKVRVVFTHAGKARSGVSEVYVWKE